MEPLKKGYGNILMGYECVGIGGRKMIIQILTEIWIIIVLWQFPKPALEPTLILRAKQEGTTWNTLLLIWKHSDPLRRVLYNISVYVSWRYSQPRPNSSFGLMTGNLYSISWPQFLMVQVMSYGPDDPSVSSSTGLSSRQLDPSEVHISGWVFPFVHSKRTLCQVWSHFWT